jgi:hypothetical protein
MFNSISPAMRPAIDVVGKTVGDILVESFKVGVATAVITGTVAGSIAIAAGVYKGVEWGLSTAYRGGEWAFDTVVDQFRGNDEARVPSDFGPVIVENHEPRDIRDIENWAAKQHNLADLEALVGRLRGHERNTDIAA